MKQLPHGKPLEITFTGLITSSMEGGHVDECISIFQRMKHYCKPNIGTINIMLKVYGRNDMFSKAKELFEEATGANSDYYISPGSNAPLLKPDEYTYSAMLEASARAQQWEYFEYVYKMMALSGYQLDQSKHISLLVEASKAGKVSYIHFFLFEIFIVFDILGPVICIRTLSPNFSRKEKLVFPFDINC